MTLRAKVVSVAVCAYVAGSSAGALVAHEPHTSMSAGSQALHKSMEKSHKDMMAMKMTGDADHDFAMMMVSHHKSALDMSDIVLKHGADPKIKDMARKRLDAQKKEIAEFEAWMKTHKPAAPAASAPHDH